MPYVLWKVLCFKKNTWLNLDNDWIFETATCYLKLNTSLFCQTADKRKAMLDELAIEMAQEKSRHKEELGNVRLQHEKEVLSIRARYEKELRGLHEEKNRTEEEIRSQLRDEKVRNLSGPVTEKVCRLRHELSIKHLTSGCFRWIVSVQSVLWAKTIC